MFSDEATYHFTRVTEYKPVTKPIVYVEGLSDNSKMIVGFNNMVVFGKFENEKHYVITVNEDLDEDDTNIPKEFLDVIDSGELFEIVTLKPTTTTTTKPITQNRTSGVVGTGFGPSAPSGTATRFPNVENIIKDTQGETFAQVLPGFNADKQSLRDYLLQFSDTFSKLSNSTDYGNT